LLTQQTARYLLKTYRSVRAGKITSKNSTFSSQYISEYLANPQARSPFASVQDLSNPEALLTAFKFRAAFLIEKAVHAIDVEQTTWNDMLVDIYRISRAHCQLLLVSNFLQAVFNTQDASNSTSMNLALQRVAILFCLSTMEQEAAEFLTSGYISPDQALMIKQQTIAALKSIRPDVVALVDAFDLPDYFLNSALGEREGNVYEKMTAMAEQEPLNHTKVADGYEDYLRPLFHKGKNNWKFDKNGIARL
jgi:acyl-CoA oxidase